MECFFYYRKQFGNDSKILILDNHDDFGGHAKRNEFHQGGPMRLSWGGTMNLEFPEFSNTVNQLMAELGVDFDTLLEGLEFEYGNGPKGSRAVYFDADTYGRKELITNCAFRGDAARMNLDHIDRFPISKASRDSLKAFYSRRDNVFPGKSEQEVWNLLSSMSFTDFAQQYGGLTEEAARLFVPATHGYWAVGADSLSAAECIGAGLPIMHLLDPKFSENSGDTNPGANVAMFPDGNASIARLLVHSLIPAVAPGSHAGNIALAQFDYSKLDRPDQSVRIRLQATAVNTRSEGNGTLTSYVQDDQLLRVRSRHAVLAWG